MSVRSIVMKAGVRALHECGCRDAQVSNLLRVPRFAVFFHSMLRESLKSNPDTSEYARVARDLLKEIEVQPGRRGLT